MNRIFEIVRTAFNSLWKMRMRGDTLEIITPFATTNDKFVSIFVSIRKKQECSAEVNVFPESVVNIALDMADISRGMTESEEYDGTKCDKWSL